MLSQPTSGVDGLEETADQVIAACGGNVCDAVKALIVANQFLETLIEALRVEVSKGYRRGYHHGRLRTYQG